MAFKSVKERKKKASDRNGITRSGERKKVGAIGTLNYRSRSIVGLAWGGEPNPGVMDIVIRT